MAAKKNAPKARKATIFEACGLGLVEDVEKILNAPPSKFDINKLNSDGYSLLMVAAKSGHIDILRLLLSKGADVNVKGIRDMTALLIACQHGCIEAVNLFLENESKPDLADTDVTGNNALMYASMNGSFQIAEILMKAGVDCNLANSKKGTALSFGVIYAKENLVEFLLNNGADTNTQDENGNTALHFAASCGYAKIINLLKANGAALDIQNNESKTPRQVAVTPNIAGMFEKEQ